MKISEVALESPLVMAKHSSHLSTLRLRSKLAYFTRCLAKLQSKRSTSSPEASWKARIKSLVESLASFASSRSRKLSTFFFAVCSMSFVGIRPERPGILASTEKNWKYLSISVESWIFMFRELRVDKNSKRFVDFWDPCLQERLLEFLHNIQNMRRRQQWRRKHIC